MGVIACVHVDEGQRSVLSVTALLVSTLYFETGSLTKTSSPMLLCWSATLRGSVSLPPQLWVSGALHCLAFTWFCTQVLVFAYMAIVLVSLFWWIFSVIGESHAWPAPQNQTTAIWICAEHFPKAVLLIWASFHPNVGHAKNTANIWKQPLFQSSTCSWAAN